MSDLPVFTPISKSPALTAAEILHLFQPANPRVAEAEAQCRAGDISVLPLLQTLVQKDKNFGSDTLDVSTSSSDIGEYTDSAAVVSFWCFSKYTISPYRYY